MVGGIRGEGEGEGAFGQPFRCGCLPLPDLVETIVAPPSWCRIHIDGWKLPTPSLLLVRTIQSHDDPCNASLPLFCLLRNIIIYKSHFCLQVIPPQILRRQSFLCCISILFPSS